MSKYRDIKCTRCKNTQGFVLKAQKEIEFVCVRCAYGGV